MRDVSTGALWIHLHWLTVLAEQGSFTRAAERLAVSKSAMSQKIKELEQQAGVPLVTRTTRIVRLTSAGEKLVEELRAPFAHIEQSFSSIRDSSGPLRGRVRVTAPVAFSRQQLVPHMTAFLRENPQVHVQLEVSDRLVSLAAEGFDLAIRHSETLPDTHVVQPLCATRALLVASPEYLAIHGCPQTPQALGEHHCLYYPRGVETPCWTFRKEQQIVTVHVTGPFSTNNSESLRDAALQGLGIAMLPDFSAQSALRDGHLVELLAEWQTVGTFASALYVVRPWSAQVPRAVRGFIHWLRDAFQPR
ncbi:LysR family transcriptional regulator [Erwinia psidii]|uniref:LysR family transcriptional regulator n=1 Tax=Erwinia psidii TaxID=69224 RepID=A0A3N6RZB3_9GAMM|nr:LysR family transcriptional regulator [Erwinia psidii]MCX8960987.1 LysR family transcriptional regulator [Erwinia psidii]MCX8967120.1 LysR family transcriptional regulator [Erwinia psidii]RQM38548.1 LysR family transcriptional regulator [Erwinia psidii]